MNLRVQKRLSAQVLGCSPSRVLFDEHSLDDIKEAITKRDIKSLVADGLIQKKPITGIAKVRVRKQARQKSKGLRKGEGSRKGSATAKVPAKQLWMNKIRVQRRFLRELKDKDAITPKTYTTLMARAKGGFFRSKKHLKVYCEENKLFRKKSSA